MSEVTIEDVITNCEDIDLETNADNLRAVYKVMTEKDSEYYIPPIFGADKMKEFIEFRKKNNKPKSSHECPNSNQPPIAPKQYQTAAANRASQEILSDC